MSEAPFSYPGLERIFHERGRLAKLTNDPTVMGDSHQSGTRTRGLNHFNDHVG